MKSVVAKIVANPYWTLMFVGALSLQVFSKFFNSLLLIL